MFPSARLFISKRTMSTNSRPKTFIHLHTLDLRTHDSPSLHLAHHSSSPLAGSITHFLPIYILDSRQIDTAELDQSTSAHLAKDEAGNHGNRSYGRSNNSPRSRVSGFHRISPHRITFLLQSILGLRQSYQSLGGDLLIGHGKPEQLVPLVVSELQKTHDIAGVWAQDETHVVEESQVIGNLSSALGKLDIPVDLKLHDSKTLVPLDRLPFKVEDVPDVYTNFRKKIEGLGVQLGGMLVEPLATGKGTEIDKVKPMPSIPKLQPSPGQGDFLSSTDLELSNLYSKLAGPLFKSPSVGGWSSSASPLSANTHPTSAFPFAGDEITALARLDDYIGRPGVGRPGDSNNWAGGSKAKTYKATRNGMLGADFSTKFSAWLSVGSLSAKEVGWRVGQLLEHVKNKDEYNNVYWILFELLWRDFFQYTTRKYALSTPQKSGKPRTHPSSALFDPYGLGAHMSNSSCSDPRRVPAEWHQANWEDKNDPARRWCEGRTGVPLIDACMVELRETGWMSNRGRQNVASFLVKDLNVDWRIGAEFFEMHLIDYDTCSNWGNWQYQAGVGNDPRSSRQFNPIKQAYDYDPEAKFVKTWLRQLADVSGDIVHHPWVNGGEMPILEQQSWKKHYLSLGKGKKGKMSENENNLGHGGENRNPGYRNGRGRGGRERGGRH